MQDTLVRYVKRRGQPIGCVAVVKVGGRLLTGWSLCHEGDQFNKRIARNMAIGRAIRSERREERLVHREMQLAEEKARAVPNSLLIGQLQVAQRNDSMPQTVHRDLVALYEQARRFFFPEARVPEGPIG